MQLGAADHKSLKASNHLSYLTIASTHIYMSAIVNDSLEIEKPSDDKYEPN